MLSQTNLLVGLILTIVTKQSVMAAGHIEVPMTKVSTVDLIDNYEGFVNINSTTAWLGTIYYGTSRIPANVTFDFSTIYQLVNSATCSSCYSQVYSPGYSLTSSSNGGQQTLSLNNVYFEALPYTDTVCLDDTANACATDVPFQASVQNPYSDSKVQGTFGMRPQSGFLNSLYDQGLIDYKMACVYMPQNETYFSVQIGNYNETYINGTMQDIFWYDNINGDNQDWALTTQTIAYGNDASTTQSENYSFVNGNEKIGLPLPTWNLFQIYFEQSQLVCDDLSCYGYGSTCDNYTVSDLIFTFQLSYFAPIIKVNISQDLLVIPLTNNSTFQCQLAIYNTQSTNDGVFGDPFFRSQYTMFDFQYNKIGLAPAAELSAVMPTPTPEPVPDSDDDDDDDDESDSTAIAVLSACLGIFVIAFAVMLFLYIRLSKQMASSTATNYRELHQAQTVNE